MTTEKPWTEAATQLHTDAPTKLAKKVGRKKDKPPAAHEDPRAELRRLVKMHSNLTKSAVAIGNMATDRKFKSDDGSIVVVKCTKSPTVIADLKASAKKLRAAATELEPRMTVELRRVSLYTQFLKNVWGFGPVCCAYLVAMVRIERAPKVSNLIRYCGNAPDAETGRAEKRHGATKYGPDGKYDATAVGTFNDELKMRIWQGMVSMYKNAAKTCAARPNGTTTKYLDRWLDAAHSRKTMERPLGAHDAGRKKATDLFLWDLYVMARTLEGLPIVADKYSAVRGHYHDGTPAGNMPYTLTIEEALAIVGDVGARPSSSAIPYTDIDLLNDEAD